MDTGKRNPFQNQTGTNVLIKALSGDIRGLTGEILGIDQKMMESLEKVSALIKDYKRVQETRKMLDKVMDIYTEKLPKLVQDGKLYQSSGRGYRSIL